MEGGCLGGGRMFEVGDKIFYPMHGAGIIQSREEKEFLGEKHLYFELNMLLKDLDIMVPVEKMSALGIRHVVEKDILCDVLARLQEGEADLSVHAGQRQKWNMDKMKSGDLYEISEVIRDLTTISRNKILGTSDKLMLDNAQQIIISEIELVLGMNTEQASERLKQAVCKPETVSKA